MNIPDITNRINTSSSISKKNICLTIPELVKEHKINLPKTTAQKAGYNLKYQMIHTKDLKVDPDYQRLVSKYALNKCGTLNRELLVTTIVSKRPESCGAAGLYVLDGQHKAIMLDESGLQDVNDQKTWLPCQVKEWPEGMLLNEIKSGEAKIFLENNMNRKEPTTVDKYRCASFMGLNTKSKDRTDYEKEAIRILEIMRSLNLVIDNFGSIKKEPKVLTTPGPFFACVNNEYREKNSSPTFASPFDKLENALELYNKVYPHSKEIHGIIFRTMFICSDFMLRGLSNGVQKCFNEYLVDKVGLSFRYTEAKLKRNQGQAAGYRYILHDRVIPSYNDHREHIALSEGKNTTYTITKEKLRKIAKENKEFADPNIV